LDKEKESSVVNSAALTRLRSQYMDEVGKMNRTHSLRSKAYIDFKKVCATNGWVISQIIDELIVSFLVSFKEENKTKRRNK